MGQRGYVLGINWRSKCCSPRVPLFAVRAPPEGAPGKVACRTCVVDAGLAAIGVR